MKVRLPKPLTCNNCNHSWQPRKSDVRRCPKCGSPYFDRPKKEEK